MTVEWFALPIHLMRRSCASIEEAQWPAMAIFMPESGCAVPDNKYTSRNAHRTTTSGEDSLERRGGQSDEEDRAYGRRQ
ncbi:unnamed protein product [Heligmosomoides polygyrus]|uniref:Secreted protein n=1 Tax=Heligmosomoides polygyrus TaxID=6339 RepID=A0A183GBN8_HELPZ|nr:unnamed protein product [Heligmosomoides polygyrus]